MKYKITKTNHSSIKTVNITCILVIQICNPLISCFLVCSVPLAGQTELGVFQISWLCMCMCISSWRMIPAGSPRTPHHHLHTHPNHVLLAYLTTLLLTPYEPITSHLIQKLPRHTPKHLIAYVESTRHSNGFVPIRFHNNGKQDERRGS